MSEVGSHRQGIACVSDSSHDIDMDGSHAPTDSRLAGDTARGGSNSEPAPASQRLADAKVTKPKRSVVHVACACCRRLRIKVRVTLF